MRIQKVSTGEFVVTVSPLVLTTDINQAGDWSEDQAQQHAADLTASTGEAFIGHVPKPHV